MEFKVKFQKFAGKYASDGFKPKNEVSSLLSPPSPKIPNRNPGVKSLGSFGGNAAKRESSVYSGDRLVGIATMHKSNLVPVWNEDQAKDLATMRRN
jgi:hypothetical protein